MCSAFTSVAWVPLAAAALAWPLDGHSQSFSANYGLRPVAGMAGLEARDRSAQFHLGPVRVMPALQAGTHFSAVGLSFQAGRNWFGQVGVERSLQSDLSQPTTGPTENLSVAGGYRWSDGQSLSLQLSRGRGGGRLGLAGSYDWPRYFVRLSYDSGLDPWPQDNLRFSAGMRF